MPELPEVETTRRGIAHSIIGRRVERFEVRDSRLRQPIPPTLADTLAGLYITDVGRRSKYLWLTFDDRALAGNGADTEVRTRTSESDQHRNEAAILIHLGMSGSLRLCSHATPLRPHDHWRLHLAAGSSSASIDQSPQRFSTLELRYHDPRRFGLCLPLVSRDSAVHERLATSVDTTPIDLERAENNGSDEFEEAAMGREPNDWSHPLWQSLGPEPFDRRFSGDYLFSLTRGRRAAIKAFIMDAKHVVGVGNIYATEALFRAGIRPGRAAGRVTRQECERLVTTIREVLRHAITRGGTTLRDFTHEDGSHGYFSHELYVYGRGGEPCRQCGAVIKRRIIGQRMSAFCPQCQR